MGIGKWFLRHGPGSPGSIAKVTAKGYVTESGIYIMGHGMPIDNNKVFDQLLRNRYYFFKKHISDDEIKKILALSNESLLLLILNILIKDNNKAIWSWTNNRESFLTTLEVIHDITIKFAPNAENLSFREFIDKAHEQIFGSIGFTEGEHSEKSLPWQEGEYLVKIKDVGKKWSDLEEGFTYKTPQILIAFEEVYSKKLITREYDLKGYKKDKDDNYVLINGSRIEDPDATKRVLSIIGKIGLDIGVGKGEKFAPKDLVGWEVGIYVMYNETGELTVLNTMPVDELEISEDYDDIA